MWQEILCKVASWIGIGLVSCLGLADPSLMGGGFNPSGGGTYRLQTSVGTTNATIKLSSFKEPVSNIKYTMTYLGSDILYGTIDPQTAYSEFISATGITQNADGTASLTGVSRGLSRTIGVMGCVASTTLAQTHAGQSVFILSNAPCMYAEYATKRGPNVISGQYQFTTAPTSTACDATGELCNYDYVNALAFQGVATSTESTIGAVMLADMSQAAASTATSTSGAPLCLISRYATTTPTNIGWNFIPVTGTTGKLSQSFLDLTQSFTWSGNNVFSGNNNLTGNTYIKNLNASSTVANPLVLNGVSTNWPSSAPSVSTSTLVIDTSGAVRYVTPAPQVLVNQNGFYSTTANATTTVYTYVMPASTIGENSTLQITAYCYQSAQTAFGCQIDFGTGSATSTLTYFWNNPTVAQLVSNRIDSRMIASTTIGQFTQSFSSQYSLSAGDQSMRPTTLDTDSKLEIKFTTYNLNTPLYIAFRAKNMDNATAVGFQGISIIKY